MEAFLASALLSGFALQKDKINTLLLPPTLPSSPLLQVSPSHSNYQLQHRHFAKQPNTYQVYYNFVSIWPLTDNMPLTCR
jgi:hypothetical protein